MPSLTVTAADSPTAMEEIISKLGEDAIILSTRKVGSKIEISASNDPIPGGLPRRRKKSERPETFTEVFTAIDEDLTSSAHSAEIIDILPLEDGANAEVRPAIRGADIESVTSISEASADLSALAREIAQLRAQFANMVICETSALRHELGESLPLRLRRQGFSQEVIAKFAHEMRDKPDWQAAQDFNLAVAAAVTPADGVSMLDADVFIISGPPGAGKTSLAAKIAAQLASHGRGVSLANYEPYNTPLHNPCRNNARVLNLPYLGLGAHDLADLPQSSPTLVIDAGSDPNDLISLYETYQRILDANRIRRIITIPGAYGARALRNALVPYDVNGAYIALTRLDECEFAAAEFSVLVESRAKIGFLTATRSLVDAVMTAEKGPVAQFLAGTESVG